MVILEQVFSKVKIIYTILKCALAEAAAYNIVPNGCSLRLKLTDILVNSGGPAEHYRGFSAIFANLWPNSDNFEGNIPSESAGVRLFKQERLLSIGQ